jgi:hypothetical protein
MISGDAWSLDGFQLCYVRPSPLDRDVAVRDLVTAPPTLHIDELGSLPLFTPSSDGECNVDCFEIKSAPPIVAVPQRVASERLERVRAAVLASFDLHRDVARDVIALGCDLTVDEWRAVLPTPPNRSFGVARLCRLIEQCRPCEALCDAVLLSVLPKLALVCTLNEDDDDPLSPVSLPPDVGALLGLLASHSSLKRIPLALLQSHALLEPLTHALSNGAFFRQHMLTCVLSDRACHRPESSVTSAADVQVPEKIFAPPTAAPLDLDDDVLLLM